ncbi:IPTL-CTERM sorting domain-containing protein [Brevundimonas vesicularis]|uniref:IPTL-CTERM sorting domain-containing protein n=1 Tax=Brevundimonas vesicularis TaxID=41276 RepID=UPI0038D3BBC9
MMKHLLALCLAGVMTLTGGATAQAQSQTIGSTGQVDHYSSNFIHGTIPTVGQRFVVPHPGGTINGFTLAIRTTGTGTTLTPKLYELTSGNATGPGGTLVMAEIWAGNNVTVSNTSARQLSFPVTPGIALEASKTYVMGVEYVSGSSAAVHRSTIANGYAEGDLVYDLSSLTGDSRDLFFEADLTMNASPALVPSLSEWAMMLFAGLLVLAGAVVLHRRGAASFTM